MALKLYSHEMLPQQDVRPESRGAGEADGAMPRAGMLCGRRVHLPGCRVGQLCKGRGRTLHAGCTSGAEGDLKLKGKSGHKILLRRGCGGGVSFSSSLLRVAKTWVLVTRAESQVSAGSIKLKYALQQDLQVAHIHITAPVVLVQIREEGAAKDGDKDGRGGTTQASRGDAGGEDAWGLRASGAESPLRAFSGIPPV